MYRLDLDEATSQLKVAFPPRRIGATGAFDEWGRTLLDGDRFCALVDGKLWTEFDAMLLERHHDAILFFGPSTISDYLPAYILAMLRNGPEMNGLPLFLLKALTRSSDGDRFDARFARMTPPQRTVVAQVLDFYEASLDASWRLDDVSAALDSYWRAYLAPLALRG